jgi:hypothetical protein
VVVRGAVDFEFIFAGWWGWCGYVSARLVVDWTDFCGVCDRCVSVGVVGFVCCEVAFCVFVLVLYLSV